MCLPCALRYQECTFLLLMCCGGWVGCLSAFTLPLTLWFILINLSLLNSSPSCRAWCNLQHNPSLIWVSTTYGFAYVHFAVIYFFFSYPYESGHRPWMVGSDFTFSCMCLSKQMSLRELQSRGLRAGQIFSRGMNSLACWDWTPAQCWMCGCLGCSRV